MASKLAVGDRVKVIKLHVIERENPEMQKFLGATGTIITALPHEWKDVFRFGRWRVKFDDPKLKYHGSEGVEATNCLNFFPNELRKV